MTEPSPPPPPQRDLDRARLRRTLLAVMSTQLVSLLLLWWLQSTYGG